jgi:hypothetical protein
MEMHMPCSVIARDATSATSKSKVRVRHDSSTTLTSTFPSGLRSTRSGQTVPALDVMLISTAPSLGCCPSARRASSRSAWRVTAARIAGIRSASRNGFVR